METYTVKIHDSMQKCTHTLRQDAKSEKQATKQAIDYLKKHISIKSQYTLKSCTPEYKKYTYFN